MKDVARALVMVVGLMSARALAQESASSAGSTAGAAETTVAPPATPASASAETPPTDFALAAQGKDVEAKADSLRKSLADNQGPADTLSKLKISGFVQGRYEWHDDSVNGWNYAAKPTPVGNAGSSTKTSFYVRRARLDTSYAGTNAEFVLQLDAGGDSVGLRDAEAAFVDTWTPLHLRVSIGQFKYAFGYELQQSDPIREMPERARMVQQFFPGERDRGLKVQGRYQMLRFQIALVNGNGIQDPIFKAGKDSNAWLDLVGRVGVDFQTVAGGVSGYYSGASLYNPAYNATSNPDTDPGNLKKYSRRRIGGDIQANLDVPKLGNLSLRGEIIYGRDQNRDYAGVAADKCQDRVSLGWSLIAAQSVGRWLGAVVRVDSYDPLLQSSLDRQACAGTDAQPGTYVTAGMDRVITYGGGLLLTISQNLKATFVYEHPTEQAGKKVDNDVFTAQMQARF